MDTTGSGGSVSQVVLETGARTHDRSSDVEAARSALAEAATPDGAVLSEVIDRMLESERFSLSAIREALTELLYSGEVDLTEDRRLKSA